MRRSRTWLLILAALVSQPLWAANRLADPRFEHLASMPELAGSFIQQRTLKGLSRPLVSKGEYAYARNQGLYWHTLSPLPSELLATPKQVKTRLPNGTEQPMAGAIEQRTSALIFALFTLDMAQLERDFAINISGEGEQWRLAMTPTSPTIALAISSIVLSGDSRVNTIEITSKEGDKTFIQLLTSADAQQTLGQLQTWLKS